MSERAERCETCRFWNPESEEVGQADCRRHAPHPLPFFQVPKTDDEAGVDLLTYWPQTEWDEWCGEWQAKEANP